jgi:hypothetical protein
MNDPPKFSAAKTDQDILSALLRQIAHMRRSIAAFDDGHLEEAERIASAVYIIANDSGKNSKSLLSQLGLKGQFKFYDTAAREYRSLGSNEYRMTPILCAYWKENGKIERYAPLLKDFTERDQVSFSNWYNGNIFRARSGNLTRQQLIYNIRSTDGGAHVDPDYKNEAYASLVRGHGRHIAGSYGDTEIQARVNLPGAHWASMRQIAHELEQTFRDNGL